MILRRPAPLIALASLLLVACESGSIPVEELATEVAALDATATPTPTATLRPTATPEPFQAASFDDTAGDCLTEFQFPTDCSGLQRDVRGVELVLQQDVLTVTLSIEGQPWAQPPDHAATFRFDTDQDSETGDRSLDRTHDLGTEVRVLWGWTPVSQPFAAERHDASGELDESFGERDDLFTVLDDGTLQLQIPIDDVGSETFSFVVSLESPALRLFDYVPEPGETLSFP